MEGMPPQVGGGYQGENPQQVSSQQSGPLQKGTVEITNDDKLFALFSHLSVFFLVIILPLIIFILKKDQSRFIAHHAKQALIFQAIVIVISIMTCGLGYIIGVIFGIIAAIKAYDGEWYTYPLLGSITG